MGIDLKSFSTRECQSRQEFYEAVEELSNSLQGQKPSVVEEVVHKFFSRNERHNEFFPPTEQEHQIMVILENRLENARNSAKDAATTIKVDKLKAKVHQLGATQTEEIPEPSQEPKTLKELGITTIGDLVGYHERDKLQRLDFKGIENIIPSHLAAVQLLFKNNKEIEVWLPPVRFANAEDVKRVKQIGKFGRYNCRDIIFEGDFRGYDGKLDRRVFKGIMKTFPNMERLMVKEKTLNSLSFYADFYRDNVFHLELEGEEVTADKVLDSVLNTRHGDKMFFNLEKLVIRDSTAAELPAVLPETLKEIVIENCPNAKVMEGDLRRNGFKGEISIM